MTKEKHIYNADAIRSNARVLGIDETEAQRLSPEGLDSRVRANYEQAGLSYGEKTVLDLRLGIGDGLAYTLEECGRIFKTTKERVRQVEANAVRKLQSSLEGSL